MSHTANSPPSHPLCPICSLSFPQQSLQSHVNSCLDAQQSPPEFDIPSPPPSDDEPSPTPISPWLTNLTLSKYTSAFLRAGIRTLADLPATPSAVKALLDTCAIHAVGPRRKLLSEIALAVRNLPPRPEPSPPPTPQQPSPPRKRKRKLWAIFEPGYKADHLPDSKNAPSAAGPSQTNPPSRKRIHHFSHRVSGTAFTVDSFAAAKSDTSCSRFFLTHFHSDHYGPLRKTTVGDGGQILCSSVTASLIHKQLCVPKSVIRVLKLGEKIDVLDGTGDGNGASVWLFDANHCPGAVIILFYVWRTKRYVLHTGDCRYDPDVFIKYHKIAEVIQHRRLDFLHLDTTYCKPQYTFPHQSSVLSQVVQAAQREDNRTRGRCLFFFGTYSIGKEKVFFAVAEALNLNIYADKRKRGILQLCEFSEKLSSRLVSDPKKARVHVIPMRSLSSDGLGVYAKKNGLNKDFIGRGLAIVFKPTGWTFRGNPDMPNRVSRSTDQAILYEVAYSEHSSFAELQAFVKWANPRRLIPTVNAYSTEQADGLRKLLGHSDSNLCTV